MTKKQQIIKQIDIKQQINKMYDPKIDVRAFKPI